ncbi:MAG TPA: fibronectin type III domain-containing protein, partial [Acidimicrobiales bacterium]|nr:fibronectin type III domain-containing protein [Acidimicrobiales bacterium]
NPSLSPLTSIGTLEGVSCADSVCEAVGEFSGAHDISAAGATTWSSGAWSSVGLAHGVPAGTERANIALFSAVSCASGTQCTAVGGAGYLVSVRNFPAEHAFSASLTPVRPVSSPSSPTVVKGTALVGGAKVAWQPPANDGGAPVHTYQATASPGGATCRTAGTHCALHGLRNGHRYRIVVTDTTSYGRSRTSSASIVLVGAKPSTPPALHLASRTGRLVASWHPARTPAGEPVRYLVKVRGPHHFSRDVVTRGHELVVAVAAAGAYSVSVTAINASGSSRPAVARHVA